MMRQQSGHERHVLFAASPELRHGEIVDFQASPGAEFVERRLPLGIRCFRLEFFNETPEQAVRTIPPLSPTLARRDLGDTTVAGVEAV